MRATSSQRHHQCCAGSHCQGDGQPSPAGIPSVGNHHTIPPVFPCGLQSYETTVISMPDSKMKEIAQEQLSKKSASHMSATVRQ
jgi:hypothetical protein